MSYVSPNYRTKKALKEAISAGVPVRVFEPGLGTVPRNGTVWIEGPHAPSPHSWYAEGEMKEGKLIRVK